MTRPRLLDLFCGAGGAAIGYHRAGFDVVGVDVDRRRLRHYPFPCVRADVFALPFELAAFDAVHASPPCQAYSVTRHSHTAEHPRLVPDTLELLAGFDGPWIVENVPGAPLPGAVELCGAALCCTADDVDGAPLVLRRHRLFLSNVGLLIPPCACGYYRARGVKVAGVYGGGPENRALAARAGGGFGYTPTAGVRRELMGLGELPAQALAQAIPPAYTELLGAQLLAAC